MKRDWIVAQIGAREHYAAARALQQQNALERLYTEFWSANPRLLKRAPAPLRALAGRHHDGVPRAKVTAFSGATLGAAARDFVESRLRRGARARDIESDYREFARVGEEFANRCVTDLKKRDLDGARAAFFGYNTGCLETLIWLRERGVPTVVGQIDPARVEEDLVRAESEKWPGWAALPGRIPATYYARLQAEWDAATRVLVNSPWSRQALIQQGVAPGKIVVVPLAYETTATTNASETRTRDENAPLQVLWLGSVLLRKGIQYLLEAARILHDKNIRFIVAGPLYISDDKAASAPPNVEFRGRVARDEAAQLYQNADLFVLPTVSDGFAITQIEAMAHGLPVIATARCGEVVTPGVDGEIVPVGDGAALASAIQTLNADRVQLRAMSAAARQKSRQFGLDRFAAGLMAALD